MDPRPSQESELDKKIVRLAIAHSVDPAASDDLQAVEAEIHRWLRSYGPRVDSEAIAQEAVMRVVARIRSARSGEIRYPARLLRVVAQRLALDQVRGAWIQRTELMPTESLDQESDDDTIAALLARDATAQLIGAAMKAAARRNDHLVIRSIAVWLELAERLGGPPTTREVAARAGVSHTSVRRSLLRFREYLSQEIERSSREFPEASDRSS
jgi:DNA-directed RNA polymerase specialized sigma24 family protein